MAFFSLSLGFFDYFVFWLGVIAEVLFIALYMVILWRRYARNTAIKNLQITNLALEATADSDKELFTEGQRYKRNLKNAVWDGIKDEINQTFMGYKKDIDISIQVLDNKLENSVESLKTELNHRSDHIIQECQLAIKDHLTASQDQFRENSREMIEMELGKFLSEFQELQKSITNKLRGQMGGKQKGINAAEDNIRTVMEDQATENNQFIAMLKRQAYGKSVSPKVKKAARHILDNLDLYGQYMQGDQKIL